MATLRVARVGRRAGGASRCSAGTRRSWPPGRARRPRRPAGVRRRTIHAAVLAATGLHCSVGIGDNKLRAKIATDFGKPRGVWQLTADNWDEVMGDRPTTALWGIGAQDRASGWPALGIDTVDQLAALRRPGAGRRARPDDGAVAAPARPGRGLEPGRRDAVGAAGARPRGDLPGRPGGLGRGRRRRPPDHPRGWSTTSTARAGPAARVGLKVRLKPFITLSRSLTLPEPTNDPDVLAEAAVSLLDRVEHDRAGPAARRTPGDGAARGRLLSGQRLSRSSRTTESTTATRSPSCSAATARWRW